MPPESVAERVRPWVEAASVSFLTCGSAAAVASWTISTSLKPPWSVTDTDRSTPGSTDLYTAVSSLTVGAGRVKGMVRAMLWPSSLVRVTKGPLPPPDRVTSFGVALGDRVPSGFVARVASTGVQTPSLRTRTGMTLVVEVNMPSALAVTVEVCVVRDSTGTS